MSRSSLFSVSILIVLFCSVAGATTYSFSCASNCDTANPGVALGATADLTLSGTTLTIKLTNTGSIGTATKYVQGDLLSGFFFGGTVNSLNSAIASSEVAGAHDDTLNKDVFGSLPLSYNDQKAGVVTLPVACGTSSTDVLCEWGMATGFTAYGNAWSGISTAGLGLFGNPATTTGQNYAPSALDGFGNGTPIGPSDLSASNVNCNGNGGICGFPLIDNFATFTLTVAPGFTLPSIVGFQYGTALNVNGIGPGPDPFFETPEPGLYGVLALGMSALFWAVVRRRTKSQA